MKWCRFAHLALRNNVVLLHVSMSFTRVRHVLPTWPRDASSLARASNTRRTTLGETHVWKMDDSIIPSVSWGIEERVCEVREGSGHRWVGRERRTLFHEVSELREERGVQWAERKDLVIVTLVKRTSESPSAKVFNFFDSGLKEWNRREVLGEIKWLECGKDNSELILGIRVRTFFVSN